MKRPPQDLIDAFFQWYASDPHSKNEDYYSTTITKNHLSGLSKPEFIEFFYKFAHEGGHLQSGGQRSSGKFRQTIESQYDQFRPFVLSPFESDFSALAWLAKTKEFKHFGSGLATIYLNRVDKERFPILNNKTADSLKLFDVKLPVDISKRYKAVLDAQKQLIDWYPPFENFYRADALNQYLIGEEEGKPWKKQLANGTGQAPGVGYWLFQGNPTDYDVVGSLRDGALSSWTVNQHKQLIKAGDKIVIWVTGENRGCYALATATSEVKIIPKDLREDAYWANPNENVDHEGVTIRIDRNLWSTPVLKEEIDDLPGFSDFPAGTRGTNFKISEDHFNGIHNLILGRNKVHYWVYAPGQNAAFWSECLEKGIMVYGANELTDLRTYENKDAIEKALKEALNLKHRPTNDARAAWEFSRVLKPGDIVIAKKGTKQYIGYGSVTGEYAHDASRATYRNLRTVKWIKTGEWSEDGGPIVQKTLTDITKYPDYVEKLKKLIGIEEITSTDVNLLPALNTILYGPPGTGKTYTLQKRYMGLFTESQTITREQYAQDLVSEMTWLQVITTVLYDLKAAKVSAIFAHPLLQAKNLLSANRTPKNTIWAWLQRHTKLDCPNVKFEKRDEPQIFWKDENATWSVDQAMVDEQLPELAEKMKMYRNFIPVKKDIKRYDYVTFHQSYCYEDFIEGIKPLMSEEDASALAYQIKPGIFRNMVTMALNDPSHNYALLIDEINRGNVASIFGELIALIEEDKRKGRVNELKARLPYSREEFVVPDNLYIIGAMNTADRSVEALDTALRRRFTFVAVDPQPDLIQQPSAFEVDLKKLLITINGRIEKLLDKDHCIGHSYFMGIEKKDTPLGELRLIFKTKVLPLLTEYFYGDPGKIGMVLGKVFVTRKDEAIHWAPGDWGMDDYEERRVYALADPMTLTLEDFQSVYGK